MSQRSCSQANALQMSLIGDASDLLTGAGVFLRTSLRYIHRHLEPKTLSLMSNYYAVPWECDCMDVCVCVSVCVCVCVWSPSTLHSKPSPFSSRAGFWFVFWLSSWALSLLLYTHLMVSCCIGLQNRIFFVMFVHHKKIWNNWNIYLYLKLVLN